MAALPCFPHLQRACNGCLLAAPDQGCHCLCCLAGCVRCHNGLCSEITCTRDVPQCQKVRQRHHRRSEQLKAAGRVACGASCSSSHCPALFCPPGLGDQPLILRPSSCCKVQQSCQMYTCIDLTESCQGNQVSTHARQKVFTSSMHILLCNLCRRQHDQGRQYLGSATANGHRLCG